MAKKSAGLLMYRRKSGIEVLLVHPGGPFWRKKDLGAWTVPKGEVGEGEELLDAAKREFEEETGLRAEGSFIELTPVKLKGGKVVHCWAVEGDCDAERIRSNVFEMEWPPGSGKKEAFPEVDRAGWFTVGEARTKILAGLVPLIEQVSALRRASATATRSSCVDHNRRMGIDDLIGNPEAFPVLRRWDFFNHAGVAPLPRAAADAIRRYAEQAEAQAYLDSGWYRDIERLRQLGAGLINAHRDEVALVKNTSEGIATVAAGIDWSPHDRIVTTAVEYPANMYPWVDVSRRHGVELVTVPEETCADGARRVPLEAVLEAAAHPRTKLAALSHVEFASGQRHDIGAVGAFCRSRGILFCVDAIQTLGVLPVDVAAMGIDYLSADGHKWLLGPEGAGFFYCRRELLAKTRPLVVGWMNVVNCEEYGSYDFTLKPDAGRFESGSYSVPAFLSLKAAVELLLSAGIDDVAARLRSLTDRLTAGVRAKGYKVVSPRGEGEWSGCVSFTSDRHDHQAVFRTLRHERHTEIAVREGRLRASPHFYNTETQIDRLVENLPGH